MQHLRIALRAFTRTPGTTSLVALTLAVALAAATLIASTIDMVWHFIPAARTNGLVFVASTDPRPERSQAGVADGLARTGVSIPDLVDWTERTSTFEAFAAFTFQSAILTGSDAPSRISTLRVTRNLPDLWGLRMQLGRTFAPDEATIGRERVVLASHDFWQNELAGASDVVGRILTIDGHPHTLIGVLPSSAATGMFRSIDVVAPIVLDRERAARDDRRLYVTGALKPGIDRERAEADLTAIARQLQTDYPRTNATAGVVVRPLMEMLGGNITAVAFLLSLIAVMILGIACANVSSIILAQAVTRRREIAVRAALGAGRFDQIRVLMIESLLVSSVAGALGLFLAWWGLVAIRFASVGVDDFAGMELNWRVFGVAIVITVLAPLGFALLPALRVSRPDMEELRQGHRGGETLRGRRLRESLVVAQVALALILMTQVGLIGRTTWRLHTMDRGFDPVQVLTLRMNLSEAGYADPAAAHDFYTRALERIRALPGVTDAGTISRLPVADRQVNTTFVIQGRPAPSPDSEAQAALAAVSADYLQTMRIPIVEGRGFTGADYGDTPPVALVSREAARQYWPGQKAIGRRIGLADRPNEWIEIIGIAGDVRNTNAGLVPTPQIYLPSSVRPERAVAFVVRGAAADPTQLTASIRSALAQLDKTQPIYLVRSMPRLLVEDLGGTYVFTAMLAAFAIVALLLAAAGVYALVSFSVSQRTREIGIRVALGARPAAILRMVVVRGSVPLLAGIVLGSAGAAALVSVTSRALSEIDARDPVAYAVVAMPLVLTTIVATYVPARRATRVDPLLTLRAE